MNSLKMPVVFLTLFTALQFTPALASPDLSLFPAKVWSSVPDNELRTYDTLWAISDIHGTYGQFTQLLFQAGLIKTDSSPERWTWSGGNSLFIAVGDYINKEGDDAMGVLLLLRKLMATAPDQGGKVIVLLGNHEAEFMADPTKGIDDKSLQSAMKHRTQITFEGKKASGKEIAKSEIGDFIRSLPVGAIVGDWVFLHSGLFDSKYDKTDTSSSNRKELVKILKKLSDARDDKDFYADLVDEKSSSSGFLKAHDWWQKGLGDMHARLSLLGITGLVVGHEPGFMNEEGTIALDKLGWITKIDAGMNMEAKVHTHGRLLKCATDKIRSGGGMKMMTDGKPLCHQVNEHGDDTDIVLANVDED
ncbi:MAG: metallophosphoesterase [Bdellovibrionales bacterium]|nr:metallophosphoesterase [Bdellovibrionales bacterium]